MPRDRDLCLVGLAPASDGTTRAVFPDMLAIVPLLMFPISSPPECVGSRSWIYFRPKSCRTLYTKTVPSHMVALGVDSVKMLAAAYPVISDLEKYPDRANLFAFRSSPLAKRAASALLVT